MKIVSKEIIKYNDPIPVYDLTVGYDGSRSNFELACGVISKNCDFSALEVCCVAFMSGATKMIEALLDGKDMHRFVASEAFGKPENEITSDERKAAKGITFGLLYGKSVESMAIDITGGDVEKAQHLFDLYFDAFPEIKTWINERHK